MPSRLPPLVQHADQLPWSPSPTPHVWRKRLELTGPTEAGRVTSLVRYDSGSVFPSHPHPEGEEILVLEGGFEDEYGSHRRHSWLRFAPGAGHTLRSDSGCTLYVKRPGSPASVC